MKPIVGPLLPPNTPPGLPHGLDRGGIFDAVDVSPQYIDASRQTVPTDSPVSHNVTTDVFMHRVGFRRPDQVRAITGYGQLPTVVHPYGQLPTVVHPLGQHVQGMGPQPGYILRGADAPPLPIHSRGMPAVPHGTEEGGIFGRGAVIGGMAVGPSVPGVRTKEVLLERMVRPLTGMRGYGSGPDGIG